MAQTTPSARVARFWDSCKAWHFLVTNPNKIPNPRNSK